MSVVLHFSDPHFGTEQQPVVEALLALARAERPELAILSGDITQRARRSQFRAARSFVDRLEAGATLCIPGNHDIPLFDLLARLWSPYGHYREAFGDDLEPVFESSTLLAVGVNTTRQSRHKHGEVSPEQVSRVCALLERARPEQLRLVVTHQPVHVVRASDQVNLLRGYDPAVRAWSQAGADALLGGHIHLPYVRPLGEGFAGLPRRTWCVQAGTALSSRVRDGVPNSVNVLRYPDGEPGKVAVERWDFDAKQARFERGFVDRLELDRPQ